jgi:hypothetical protein
LLCLWVVRGARRFFEPSQREGGSHCVRVDPVTRHGLSTSVNTRAEDDSLALVFLSFQDDFKSHERGIGDISDLFAGRIPPSPIRD